MAAPLPVSGVRPNVDFRDPRTLTPLVKKGGICQLADIGDNIVTQLLPTVIRLVTSYQGSPNSVPEGTEGLLDALYTKTNEARLAWRLNGFGSLTRDQALLVNCGDGLWQALCGYKATREARQKFPDITYGSSRPK